MSLPPPWFDALLSTLVRAAPDLVTGAAGHAAETVAAAVTESVPGCSAAAVVFPVLRSGGRVDRPFPEGDPGGTLSAALAAESVARAGPVRDVCRAKTPGALHLADTLADPRWPAFGQQLSASTHDLRALAVLPLHVASRGALLVGATRPHALDEVAESLTALVPAVELFLRLAWAEIRLHHARDGIESRRIIATATGILMSTDGVAADGALTALRGRAQATGRALLEVASDLVGPADEASAR
ncbi:ANTAR domain-containing protein [Jatrophihabitans sp. YIM 134969]